MRRRTEIRTASASQLYSASTGSRNYIQIIFLKPKMLNQPPLVQCYPESKDIVHLSVKLSCGNHWDTDSAGHIDSREERPWLEAIDNTLSGEQTHLLKLGYPRGLRPFLSLILTLCRNSDIFNCNPNPNPIIPTLIKTIRINLYNA